MKALGLGFSGAHRTGKTTLANKLRELNSCPFAQTSMSKIATDMGIKVGLDMAFEDRIRFQEAGLAAFEADYSKAGSGLFVTDRTPLDLAAYVITAWHPSFATPEQTEWARDYVKRCVAATNKWFFQVTIVQPADIPYADAEQKGENIDFYRDNLNSVILGLAWSDEIYSAVDVVPRSVTRLDDRVRHVTNTYSDNITEYVANLAHLPLQ